jgi:hypothetical protein
MLEILPHIIRELRAQDNKQSKITKEYWTRSHVSRPWEGTRLRMGVHSNSCHPAIFLALAVYCRTEWVWERELSLWETTERIISPSWRLIMPNLMPFHSGSCSSSIYVIDALAGAYNLGSTDKYQNGALLLSGNILQAFRESQSILWLPTSDDMEHSSDKLRPSDLVRFASAWLCLARKTWRRAKRWSAWYTPSGKTYAVQCQRENRSYQLKHMLLCVTVRHLFRASSSPRYCTGWPLRDLRFWFRDGNRPDGKSGTRWSLNISDAPHRDGRG